MTEKIETTKKQTLEEFLGEMDQADAKQIESPNEERKILKIHSTYTMRDSAPARYIEPVYSAPYVTELAQYIRQKEKEHPGAEILAIMLLDINNSNIGIQTVAVGDEEGIIVEPRQIFEIALHPSYRARGIIHAHNHTSGDWKPSRSDFMEWRRIKAIGEVLQCRLKDALVFGVPDYYSLKNETLGELT